MKLNFDDTEKPIFIQLAEFFEDNILNGVFQEETQIPSVAEIAYTYKINPATANKSVNVLVNEGIVYKKRGLGMFVVSGAREIIKKKRDGTFIDSFVVPIVTEARKLGISKNKLINYIERNFDEEDK